MLTLYRDIGELGLDLLEDVDSFFNPPMRRYRPEPSVKTSVVENETSRTYSFEVPGFTEKELDLTVTDKSLTLQGKKADIEIYKSHSKQDISESCPETHVPTIDTNIESTDT